MKETTLSMQSGEIKDTLMTLSRETAYLPASGGYDDS